MAAQHSQRQVRAVTEAHQVDLLRPESASQVGDVVGGVAAVERRDVDAAGLPFGGAASDRVAGALQRRHAVYEGKGRRCLAGGARGHRLRAAGAALVEQDEVADGTEGGDQRRRMTELQHAGGVLARAAGEVESRRGAGARGLGEAHEMELDRAAVALGAICRHHQRAALGLQLGAIGELGGERLEVSGERRGGGRRRRPSGTAKEET